MRRLASRASHIILSLLVGWGSTSANTRRLRECIPLIENGFDLYGESGI